MRLIHIVLLTFLIPFLSNALASNQQKTDSLINKLEQNLPDSQKVDIFNKLSRLLFYSNPDSARYFANQAFNVSDKKGFNNRKAYSLVTYGFLNDEAGKYDSSIINYREAIDIYKKTGDQEGLSYAVLNKGLAYMHMGDHPNALKAFQEASEIARNIEYANILGASLINIGIIQRKQGSYNQALEYYTEALEIFESHDQKRNVANAYSNMGVVRTDIGNHKIALKNFKTALKIYNNLNDKRGTAINYANIAGIHEQTKNYNEALEYYNSAKKTFEILGDKERIAKTLASIASVYFQIAENANRKNLKTKNYKLAIKNAKEANTIAQETGAWKQIMSANKVLSETHENMGNKTQALNYYKIYHEAKDSLFNLEKNRQIEELEIKYQTERKEKQIQLLEKNRELQEDKLKQSRNIQYISITATSVILVLLFIIFYRYRHQKKLAGVLAEKNDVISKQREKYQKLNDTKNRILSVISHELRSPLSLIINFSDLVQEGNLEKERMIEYNRYTYQNAYSLLHLLENLLEWTKNQQNEIYIQRRKQPLCPVIINNLEILNNLAKNKHIEIKTSFKQSEIQAFFDYDMVSTVMRNLISNAIKFTPEGGKIEISVEERKNEVKIEVKDTGVGISNTDKQKILDEQNHYTNTGTQQEKGTGIGLVITKEFIEKNNGTLHIESKPNEGSKFWFTLPIETN